jgi:hypothetical protein
VLPRSWLYDRARIPWEPDLETFGP